MIPLPIPVPILTKITSATPFATPPQCSPSRHHVHVVVHEDGSGILPGKRVRVSGSGPNPA